MSKIVIVGGGFAGVWAALTASREVLENDADMQVTVISKQPYLEMRPRLYEGDAASLRTPLAPSFNPLEIKFVQGIVNSVNVENKTVLLNRDNGGDMSLGYDRLILATGSAFAKLPIPGLAEHGWNIDTYDGAVSLDQHLGAMLQTPDASGHNTFIIIGAGLTGIELALEMRDRIAAHSDWATAEEARIILIEKTDVIGPDLGANPRPIIEAALRDANVEVKLGTSVETVTPETVTLVNGEKINTKTVITTAGLQASSPDGSLPVERDELGRIPTDENLRVKGLSNVFATGDVARAYVDDEHLALMSCQHAMKMGKFAGYNAARDLLGLHLRPYRQPDYVTCLDLGRSGAVLTSGWDRQIQMSGDDAKDLKRQINTQWIYPPVGTREEILAAAHLDAKPGGN